MTLKAHEGTKIHPSTQIFFLQTFSFVKKKPNPKPIAISGSLQAPLCAPLLFSGFASELKDQILLLSLGKPAF